MIEGLHPCHLFSWHKHKSTRTPVSCPWGLLTYDGLPLVPTDNMRRCLTCAACMTSMTTIWTTWKKTECHTQCKQSMHLTMRGIILTGQLWVKLSRRWSNYPFNHLFVIRTFNQLDAHNCISRMEQVLLAYFDRKRDHVAVCADIPTRWLSPPRPTAGASSVRITMWRLQSVTFSSFLAACGC